MHARSSQAITLPLFPPRALQHFHRSSPMPCPYLPGRIERKLFSRLSGPFAAETNSALSRAGFRRSHDLVYRPVCPACDACVPVRLPVAKFRPSRTQRRIARVFEDLTLTEAPPLATVEQYGLFAVYQQARHGDSDMARMSYEDFVAMVDEGSTDTGLFELRSGGGELIGCMLVDRLSDGYSAVYSFFDPERPGDSLGTALILKLIERAAATGRSYIYLGYWIAGSRKMTYKTRFRPIEALGPEGWKPME